MTHHGHKKKRDRLHFWPAWVINGFLIENRSSTIFSLRRVINGGFSLRMSHQWIFSLRMSHQWFSHWEWVINRYSHWEWVINRYSHWEWVINGHSHWEWVMNDHSHWEWVINGFSHWEWVINDFLIENESSVLLYHSNRNIRHRHTDRSFHQRYNPVYGRNIGHSKTNRRCIKIDPYAAFAALL